MNRVNVKRPMTIRERINECLASEPYARGATATQICACINASFEPQHSQWCVRFDGHLWSCDDTCTVANPVKKVKLSSVSSELAKMVKRRSLRVLPGFGPRGGNGYVMMEMRGEERT